MEPSRLAEPDLAAAALEGSSPAWSEIARRHSRRVRAALLARGVAFETAEDLVQETWARLLARQRQGRLASMALPGLAIAQALWLARESRRTWARREAIASRAGEAETEETGPAADPERAAIGREALQRIRRALERCPARGREVFLAIYGESARSPAEVARDLGISVQRVRQILCETRARLRREARLDEEGVPE